MTPKQHFLIHYPSSILRFGPPRDYWIIRFEAKHQYFKSADTATFCQINVLKSLAERHQNLQLFHLTSQDFFIDRELGTKQSIESSTQYTVIEMLLQSKKFEGSRRKIY